MKKTRKIENYDMTLSVADNEKIIKSKYDRINSATGLAKYAVDKVTDRPTVSDSFLVIDPNPVCTTQWEQVPVYKAWDGNWYIKDTVVPCPKGMYGDKCHIKCDDEIGCVGSDTPEQIIAKKKAYRKKKCDEQQDAKYCEYIDYNPPGMRTTKFQERTKQFVSQADVYKQTVDSKNTAQKARMFALDTEIQKEEDYKLKLADDYSRELAALDAQITALTKQIDDTNAKISELTKQLIEQRVSKINMDADKSIQDIITNAKNLDDNNKKLEQEIALLNQKVDNSNRLKDTLQNQYNTLKGLPSKESVTQATATKPAPINTAAKPTLPAPPATKPTPATGAPKATIATKKSSICPIL